MERIVLGEIPYIRNSIKHVKISAASLSDRSLGSITLIGINDEPLISLVNGFLINS
jgi:hypothetical protein